MSCVKSFLSLPNNGRLMICLQKSFSAARGGRILKCGRRATKPWGILGATHRAAALFGSRFVARSSQTTAGMLVARRLAGAENPSRQTVSYLGNTTLAEWRLDNGFRVLVRPTRVFFMQLLPSEALPDLWTKGLSVRSRTAPALWRFGNRRDLEACQS